MGNRTYMEKTLNGTVVEWHRYEYNESNQLISEKLYNGKKTTSLAYTYDADGNRISETGRIGTDKVNRTYEYSVENRLAAVHDGDELLLAAAYDGDGNRVFLLNYNLHTDDDWKGNSGNGNGNNIAAIGNKIIYPPSPMAFDNNPRTITQGKFKEVSWDEAPHKRIHALINPECWATPSPNIAMITIPKGANPVKFLIALRNHQRIPSGLNRLCTRMSSPVCGNVTFNP